MKENREETEGMIYGYEPEEIFPVTAYLTKKYTSGESSSVPYETAEMLMEAVIYCIREFCTWNESGIYGAGILSSGNRLSAREAYEKGYEYTAEKVRMAKSLYEDLIEDFEDYGCLNYRKTVLEGLPAFFVNYDIRFKPQDHILMLDYPDMAGRYDLCGADRIYSYLSHLTLEKEFLEKFDREAVCRTLDHLVTDYQELYMENICEAVLFQAVKCIIADRPVGRLETDGDEGKLLSLYFDGDTPEQAALKTEALIRLLAGAVKSTVPGFDSSVYFAQMGKSFAFRYLLSAGRKA